MSRILRVCTVVAALSPAACILFEGTDDLTGGTGSDADAAAFDATGDAAIGDAISRDTSTPGDGSAPTCDAQFCESFDLSSSLPGVFTPSYGVDSGGTIAIVARGLSLPNAVEFDQPINGGSSVNAIVHTFPGAPPAFHCELDLQLESDPQVNNELDVVVISAQGLNHTPGYEMLLAKFGPTWTLAEYSDYDDGGQFNQQSGFTAPPKIGSWTHLVFASDGSTLTATFDGNTLGILPSLSSAGSQTATSRTLSLGSEFALVNTSEIKILIDNVACSFGP